jgi:hypothetical protein
MDAMPRELPEALEAAGIQLDPSARHPTYTTDGGFVSIQVDAKRYQASIASRGGTARKVPSDVATILGEVARLRERLFGDRQPVVTRETLVNAYQSAREKAGPASGADVPLEDIRAALVTGKHVVALDEFNIDLGRVLAEASRTGSPRIAVSNTRDINRGVLLYGMEQAGYVGYLRLEGDTT